MSDDFAILFKDFQNEFTHIQRNTISDVNSKIGKEIFKLGSGNFDTAISIIIKQHGNHIEYLGKIAIETFINYLKLYKAVYINNENIMKTTEYVSDCLKNIASSARINANQYVASKGNAFYLNLDVLWVGKELELRIPPILEKLKIEVRKYVIEETNNSKSNLSKMRIKFYYVSKDEFEEIKNNKRRANLDYDTDIFVELINDKYDIDKITGYIIARGGYHTHTGIKDFRYFMDYQCDKPGYFTSDGNAYYKIMGFLKEGDVNTGKVLINLQREDASIGETIYLAGQSFDAIKHISSIMSEAKKSVFLIDGYIDEDVLNLFADKSKDVEVKILTHSLKQKVETFAKKFNLQYGNLHIRVSKSTHDRILIVDETELYSLGASVKDIGLKTSILSKLKSSSTIDNLQRYFKDEWDKADKII